MIDAPYTLFTRICIYRDDDGTFYADPLWELDLSAHLEYLSKFRICCPVEPLLRASEPALPIAGLEDAQVIGLRQDRGWGSVFRNFIPNFLRVRDAVRAAKIVHSEGAGWAFPLSYYILPLRLFRQFKWVIVIESSFWMKPKTGPVTWRQSIGHWVHMRLLRACLQMADARVFTQDWYRRTLYGGRDGCLIAPAVWVAADQIIDADMIDVEDRADGTPLKALFAARLVPEKGTQTVLDAIERLNKGADTPQVTIDIMGRGPMAEECRAFCAERSDDVTRFREPVDYGAPFFEVLRDYDALIVANVQDEQPRIVFDAYSQGVPCIVTRTEGLKDIVPDGKTGYQFDVGDGAGLANLLTRIASGELPLQSLRLPALNMAKAHTHAQMHRDRELFLKETLKL